MIQLPAKVVSAVLVLGVALLPISACAAPLSRAAIVQSLPGGLTIPIEMEHGIKAGATRPGTVVHAYITQRVLLGDGTYLPRGVKVLGTVVTSVAAGKWASRPAVLTIRFDALRYRGQTIPIRTHAVAVANVMNVEDTNDRQADLFFSWRNYHYLYLGGQADAGRWL